MAMLNPRFRRSVPARIREQRGAALIVGLMFLVLITLLATIAMRQSITQERMAGGLRNATLAAANFLFRLLDLVGAGSATVLVPDCSAACTRDLLI